MWPVSCFSIFTAVDIEHDSSGTHHDGISEPFSEHLWPAQGADVTVDELLVSEARRLAGLIGSGVGNDDMVWWTSSPAAR